MTCSHLNAQSPEKLYGVLKPRQEVPAFCTWGDTGPLVRKLQRLLNERTDSELKVDGIFGPLTNTALLNYQRGAGLKADGIAGRRTFGALALDTGRVVTKPKAPVSSALPGIGQKTKSPPPAGAPAPIASAATTNSSTPHSSTSIDTWSIKQIAIEVLKRTGSHLPKKLADQWRAVTSPESLEMIAGAIVITAAAHLVGIGEIVDVIMLGVGVVVAGTSAFKGGMEFGEFMKGIVTASTSEDLDIAAQHLANAVMLLGVATVMALLMRKSIGGGGAAAEDSAGAEAAESAPAKAPAPKPKPATSAAKSSAGDAAADDAATASTLSQNVYRVDGRAPGTIFDQGFQPKGTSTDLKTYVDTNNPSSFVSTSKTPAIADNPDFAKPGTYLYEVDGSQVKGIDVNAAYPDNPFANESEIAVVGGVPPEAIISAKPVLPGGGLGPTIPNPNYKGGL